MTVAISGAVIRGSKILLVRKKDVWILPGGKIEKGESALACLSREFAEELGVDIEIPSFFARVSGATPHKGYIIDVHVYLCEIIGTPVASAEISELTWVSYGEIPNVSEPTKLALQTLHKNGYL